MKALMIKIRDAGVFKNPCISGSQDKVLSYDGKISRFNKRNKECTPYLNIPAGSFSYKHVANLLRVLWGERPVPTLRKVHDSFIGDSYFENIAKNVRVKVETPILDIDKVHKEKYYPEEITTVRKSIKDSWQTATKFYFLDGEYVSVKGGTLYPDRLCRYLGNEIYVKFIALVSMFGTTNTVKESIELLNVNKKDERVIDFCKECKENKKTSLSNIILNSSPESFIVHVFSKSSPLNTLMSCGTVEKIEKFSAELYVPVTDEDIKRIENGTGIATFMEGGLATVEGIEDWSEMLEIGTQATIEGELVNT